MSQRSHILPARSRKELSASLKVRHRPEYLAFCNARLRCTSKRTSSYPAYGGRGIEFRFKSFEQFYELLGERPSGCLLDRIDVNGHYEPGNVRWATRAVSDTNRRRSYVNPSRISKNQPYRKVKEIAFRESWSLAQVAEQIGINYGTLHTALNGGIVSERTLFKINQFIEKQEVAV